MEKKELQNKVLDEIKKDKGMIFLPKALLYKLETIADVAVYDYLNKLYYFDKEDETILDIKSAAKAIGVTEDSLRNSLITLELLNIIEGKLIIKNTYPDWYRYKINYEIILNIHKEINKPKIISEKEREKEFEQIRNEIKTNLLKRLKNQ